MDDEDNLEEQVNPVDVEVEEPTDEIVEEDAAPEEDNFYKNLACLLYTSDAADE